MRTDPHPNDDEPPCYDDHGAVVDEIAAERARQVEEEGWWPGHDDKHDDGSLAMAAAAYAYQSAALPNLVGKNPRLHEASRFTEIMADLWPWTDAAPKGDRRRQLVKAGALIVAEIERLDRATGRERSDG